MKSRGFRQEDIKERGFLRTPHGRGNLREKMKERTQRKKESTIRDLFGGTTIMEQGKKGYWITTAASAWSFDVGRL